MPSLTEDQIAEIEENFDHFDSDNNGTIDYTEYTHLLEALGAGMKENESKAGFAHIDSDNNGKIDFDEFIRWWGDRYVN